MLVGGYRDVTHNTVDICLYARERVHASPLLTCSWACEESWSEAIKKTFVWCFPCYTISPRPANTMFPSCAPHWLFSQMAKSSRCGGGGEGALFYFGTFYNPILFDTVRLSGSHFKKGQKHNDPCRECCWHYICARGTTYRLICTAPAKQDSPYLE